MKQRRKDLIKRAHKAACSDWKKEIENEWPKLFTKKEEVQIGKWYKCLGFLFYVYKIEDNKVRYYGFDNGVWKHDPYVSMGSKFDTDNIPATDEEVKEALTKEAKKRGFKEGGIFRTIGGECMSVIDLTCGGWQFFNDSNNLSHWGNGYFFKQGKWAEIITETITKADAEKELGKTIID